MPKPFPMEFESTKPGADPTFGTQTKNAVIDFQNRHGLVPDGIFEDNSRNPLCGVYEDMVSNSVSTPTPGDPLGELPICQDSAGGACDPGEVDGSDGWAIITAVGCGGIGFPVGLMTFPLAAITGVSAAVGCSILTG